MTHSISEPTTRRHLEQLLGRSDPAALGELQRLAIGFRLATLETPATDTVRRMRRFLDGRDPFGR
jgi:hypothetical protein